MKNEIHNLEINNFKSIRHLELDCKRINVFIGKPNVGKSNILEAISLYACPYLDFSDEGLKNLIRFEDLINLFYDSDNKNNICVNSNIGSAGLRYHDNSIDLYDFVLSHDKISMEKIFASYKGSILQIEGEFDKWVSENRKILSNQIVKPFYSKINRENNFDQNRISLTYDSPVKPYRFTVPKYVSNRFRAFLRPPFGDNLYSILESNPSLFEHCSYLFSPYNLDLLLDTSSKTLDVQKRVGHKVYKYPYSLAADTLQRMIFHFAAIESNTDSILLFEEPEAHSFPPYISSFAERVIESKENQFFIGTHSPYILQPFIEQCNPDEIRIFVCTYENYETKARALSEEEIANILETGIDLFFNIPAFEK